MIRKKRGVKEFQVIDLMEWFMKSMIDVMKGMDYVINDKSSQKWPRMQTLKQLFNDIVKPIEKLVVNMYPLPEYQLMRYN